MRLILAVAVVVVLAVSFAAFVGTRDDAQAADEPWTYASAMSQRRSYIAAAEVGGQVYGDSVIDRRQVLRFRIRAQQLDRAIGTIEETRVFAAQEPQGVVLLRGEVVGFEEGVFLRSQPIVRSPQVQIGFLLGGVKVPRAAAA